MFTHTLPIGTGGADSLINVGSDDETPIIDFRRQTEHRRLLDHYNSIVNATPSSRFSRSGRRSRRIADHPYFTRNELDNNPNSRTLNHRRVRFSSINRGLNDVSIIFFLHFIIREYLLLLCFMLYMMINCEFNIHDKMHKFEFIFI